MLIKKHVILRGRFISGFYFTLEDVWSDSDSFSVINIQTGHEIQVSAFELWTGETSLDEIDSHYLSCDLPIKEKVSSVPDQPKPVNFRPNMLEDLILERLQIEYGFNNSGKAWSKSELVRFCIREAGEKLLTQEEYNELLLYSARF